MVAVRGGGNGGDRGGHPTMHAVAGSAAFSLSLETPVSITTAFR